MNRQCVSFWCEFKHGLSIFQLTEDDWWFGNVVNICPLASPGSSIITHRLEKRTEDAISKVNRNRWWIDLWDTIQIKLNTSLHSLRLLSLISHQCSGWVSWRNNNGHLGRGRRWELFSGCCFGHIGSSRKSRSGINLHSLRGCSMFWR